MPKLLEPKRSAKAKTTKQATAKQHAFDAEALVKFLLELSFNNNKAWFDKNRLRYSELRLGFTAFMAELITRVATFDKSVKDVSAKDTLFRINRDIRFSNNKDPYKTSFSAAISSGGRHSTLPIYYLELRPESSMVAGGVYLPEASDLAVIRAYTERYPERADALLNHKGLKKHFAGLGNEATLQRFPRGFSEGSELLKYKSFTVSKSFDVLEPKNLVEYLAKPFEEMAPLHVWLRDALAYRKPK
jgi:uncharacterized protein (TIGR02453 family)